MKASFENKNVASELLAQKGYPAVAKMISHFDRPADMDKALGLPGNSHNWYSLRTMPSKAAERLAEIWVKNNFDQEPDKESSDCNSENELSPASFFIEKEEKIMFLITCPPGKKENFLRIVELMKCDSVLL